MIFSPPIYKMAVSLYALKPIIAQRKKLAQMPYAHAGVVRSIKGVMEKSHKLIAE